MNRQTLKNVLRDKTCDTCVYKVIKIPVKRQSRTACTNSNMPDEFPKSNSCDRWKSQDEENWINVGMEHAKAVASKLSKLR